MKRKQIGKFIVCLFTISTIGEMVCYKNEIEFSDAGSVESMGSQQSTQKRGKNTDTSTFGYVNSDDDKNYESNMIVYDYLNKKLNEEYFNPNSYLKRTPTTLDDEEEDDDGKYHNPVITNPGDIVGIPGILPYTNDNSDIVSLMNPILSYDFDFVDEKDKETEPYLQTCIMLATFEDVNIGGGKTMTCMTYGTGFLAGPNVVVGAGHTIYCDPYESSRDDDSQDYDFILPSEIRVYFVTTLKELGYSECEITYKYTAGVNAAYITKSYYETRTEEEDWCVLELDDNIGDSLGYLELEEEHTAKKESVFTCGYRRYMYKASMLYSNGRITKTSGNRYTLKMAIFYGQSGSPIIREDNGQKKVCGIVTQATSSLGDGGYGVMCYRLFYRFVDSFMNSNMRG